jgi:hypothetical protein
VTRPAVPAVTDTWYDELAVIQPDDEALGWPFLIFLAGLGVTFGPLHDLVRDSDAGPGWSAAVDPERAPVWALPWTAQFAGVTLTPGLDEPTQRWEITSPPAFERGSTDALISRAQRLLTGQQRVTVLERDGSEWRTTVITYTSETPDPAATERDVLAEEMGGERIVYRVDPGWSVGQLEDEYSTRTVGDVEAAFATVGDLESNL